MRFNVRDLDQDALKVRATYEAQLIFSKSSTRRNRSLEEIIETCLYGHAAEQYLIEKKNFIDDTRQYKDVVSPNGEPVEVKVTEGEYYVPYVIERARKAASEAWRKYPNWLYIFIGDRKTLNYTLQGIYLWNGKHFCLHHPDNVV